jgi:hypothetical protein
MKGVISHDEGKKPPSRHTRSQVHACPAYTSRTAVSVLVLAHDPCTTTLHVLFAVNVKSKRCDKFVP